MAVVTPSANPENLHYLLIRHIVSTGHAPDLSHLSSMAALSSQETERGLKQLEEMRGVILAPGSTNIRSLHPFALIPTSFWVAAGRGGWWANCAWCSLGVGAALHEDVAISTWDGAEGRPLELRIENGRANRSDLLLHFPYPPGQWWDDPYCPCGNILFFSSEADIDVWCSRHGHPKGAILNMETGIALAERWFGDYASPDWRRKSPQQAAKIFGELALDRTFWTFDDSLR